MVLVLLKRFDNAIEAALARSFLDSEGISSFVFDGAHQYGGPASISIPARLMVAEEDLEDAARVLRDADGAG